MNTTIDFKILEDGGTITTTGSREEMEVITWLSENGYTDPTDCQRKNLGNQKVMWSLTELDNTPLKARTLDALNTVCTFLNKELGTDLSPSTVRKNTQIEYDLILITGADHAKCKNNMGTVLDATHFANCDLFIVECEIGVRKEPGMQIIPRIGFLSESHRLQLGIEY